MESGIINCASCGKEIKEIDKFCTGCGSKNEAYVQNLGEKRSLKNKLFISTSIVVVIMILFVLIAPNIFAIGSPTNYVKSAMIKTIEVFGKNNEKFNGVPTLTTLFSSEKGSSQGELYLKIEELSGFPIDTSMLNEYGLKFIGQSNRDKDLYNYKLALMKGTNEVVDGSVYYDAEKIALEVPKLFEDILAVKINDIESDTNNESTEDKDLNAVIKNYCELIEASKDIESIFKELFIKYLDKFANLATFEKDESNKNLYNATIEGEDLVLIVKEFITELYANEDFKEYLALSMYFSEGYYSKEYYADLVESMALSMPDEFDYALEEVEVGQLNLNVLIENKTVRSLDANFNVTSSGEKLNIEYTMNINDDKQGIDFELKYGADSYDSIIGSINYSKDDDGLKRNTSLKFNTTELGGAMFYDYTDILKDDKTYEAMMTCNLNDGYQDFNFIFNAVCSLKNNDRIDYENIGLSFAIDDYIMSCNLSGYAANTKIKSLDEIDNEKLVFIEELNDDDLNELYEEMNKNLYLIMQSLNGSI